jgi:hypothetical protein
MMEQPESQVLLVVQEPVHQPTPQSIPRDVPDVTVRQPTTDTSIHEPQPQQPQQPQQSQQPQQPQPPVQHHREPDFVPPPMEWDATR